MNDKFKFGDMVNVSGYDEKGLITKIDKKFMDYKETYYFVLFESSGTGIYYPESRLRKYEGGK